jgi:hypothetical protein
MFVTQVAVEIASYLTSKSADGCDDVLSFWKKSASSYPHVAQLARLHLAATATSVPVECMFSTTGLVTNSKRSSLSAEKLHRITFIHDNFNLLAN